MLVEHDLVAGHFILRLGVTTQKWSYMVGWGNRVRSRTVLSIIPDMRSGQYCFKMGL